MGTSARAQRRQVSVIGPIWPTASRPTIEWPAQIRVVRTSSSTGLAQADCISPALGAVASVIRILRAASSAFSEPRSAHSVGSEHVVREEKRSDDIGGGAAEGNRKRCGFEAGTTRRGFPSRRNGRAV